MLVELRVENLLLIERAELRLAPGLNVLTGETGAGKTVLAHALDLLLGGRARAGIVRPGAREAYVEGAFDLTPGLRHRLGERLSDDAQELVLARRVSSEGRTRAYVNGRSASVGELRDLGSELLSFYGQHEHRKLMLASAQMEILDAYCGPDQARRRAAFERAHAHVGDLAASLNRLRELAGGRERELDLVEFELAEIDSIAPEEAESGELHRERERLRHVDGLRAAALTAAEALSAETAEGGAAAPLGAAERALGAVDGVDPAMDALSERARALVLEAAELAADLRRYGESVESVPGRLDQVEERLEVLRRLERKHGGSIAAVLAHAEHCRARRDELAGAEVALETAVADLVGATDELERLAGELSDARRGAAPALASAVRDRLGELAMEGAEFDVALQPGRRGPSGDDVVEFRIAPNPGVLPGPLREIASGGELSRVMLALMGAAEEAGGGAGELLVFDEVDAGVGGQTARVVGERLRALAQHRQVLCITHLPQVASLAERHFRIAKDAAIIPARASVSQLERGELVGALVRMLGAEDADPGAQRHARELLKVA
ncbi:MAG: DNA repair protein RecN [Actinomycetota bacterium]|nr:DNA repair protein RecN [Actinomycetota bacterium]